MSQDFQKIAEEAIKQCAEYEARINQLQEQIALTKKANLVDPELVKKSVEALTKTGGITAQQADETAQLLAHDPNASLRAIQALCDSYTDAAPIVKKESDIQGGRLVDAFNKQASAAPVEDAYAAVARVLGLKMNK